MCAKVQASSKQICLRDLLSSDCANTTSFRASREERSSTSNLPPGHARDEGYHGKYLFTTLFFQTDTEISEDEELVEEASARRNSRRNNIFAVGKQMFTERNEYLTVADTP